MAERRHFFTSYIHICFKAKSTFLSFLAFSFSVCPPLARPCSSGGGSAGLCRGDGVWAVVAGGPTGSQRISPARETSSVMSGEGGGDGAS